MQFNVQMQFNIIPRIRQFTHVHKAKCHSTISWIMSSYFPINWLQGNSMCIDSRQFIRLCPYQMGNATGDPRLLANSIINDDQLTLTKLCHPYRYATFIFISTRERTVSRCFATLRKLQRICQWCWRRLCKYWSTSCAGWSRFWICLPGWSTISVSNTTSGQLHWHWVPERIRYKLPH